MTAGGHLSFPRQHARTQRFSLGVPRAFAVAADGSRVAFVRAVSGEDPRHQLWVLDVGSGEERSVFDGADPGVVPPEERARRERVREGGAGVVAFATDRQVTRAVFALGGSVHLAELGPTPSVRALPIAGPVVDPRLDPAGRRVAFVRAGALWVSTLDGDERCLAADDDPAVTWGLAEFVAAEEMGRTRGYWWSPDGTRIAAARVDVGGVERWHIADPAAPRRPPAVISYPAATTANAVVRLSVFDLEGSCTDVAWDDAAYPYLANVAWDEDPLTLLVQSRDQRRVQVRTPERVVADDEDAAWVDLVPGVPRFLPDGRLVHVVNRDDTRRVAVDGTPVTPPGLHVRGVVAVDPAGVVVTASGADPTAVAVWRVPLDGRDPFPVTPVDGVAEGAGNWERLVTVTRELAKTGAAITVADPAGPVASVRSVAATPVLTPRPRLLRLGPRDLRGALLLPPGEPQGPLPVLLDPYGGPHAQRVLRRSDAFLVPQWFADQGFAVLVADGRGSPGRGPAWERAVAGDLAGPPLEDQVDALHAAAAAHPGLLDLERVAIRGWSFGGFLAALAVLRRPDVFAAAIAGAPVTDWRLYDTHYTERYLGTGDGASYDRSSLLDDAPRLARPLLLIHGLADDNVVVAHTLRLSQALLAAGRPHRVLPLSGVTHMTPQEVVAENLLRVQLAFLREVLHV